MLFFFVFFEKICYFFFFNQQSSRRFLLEGVVAQYPFIWPFRLSAESLVYKKIACFFIGCVGNDRLSGHVFVFHPLVVFTTTECDENV